METITAILTTIFALFSSAGVILNNSLANLIKNQSYQVEELAVRVNNVPSYRILEGEVQQIQIAMRGWELREDIRLEVFEIETDKVRVNLDELDEISGKNWQKVLTSPLSLGFHVVITENDLNKALQSALVNSLIADLSENSTSLPVEVIRFSFDLLPDNQVKIKGKVKLLSQKEQILDFNLQFGLELSRGYQLKIVQPQGTLNGRQLSSKLLQGFANNINIQLNLRNLEQSGIIVRLLQLDITENKLDIIGLAHVDNQ